MTHDKQDRYSPTSFYPELTGCSAVDYDRGVKINKPG